MSNKPSQSEPEHIGRLNTSHVFSALFVLLAVGLAISGSTSHNRMQDLFGKSTYYILWILFLVWIVQFRIFLVSIDFSCKAFLKEIWLVLVVALLLTIITSAANTPKYRVLSDESNLASVSRSMVESKTVYNYTTGKFYYNTFHPLIAELDKRPMLFPFFVHLLHIIRGYAVNNLFYFNLLLHFTLLAAVGVIVRRIFNRMAFPKSGNVWIAEVLLVFLCPILTLTATSGGFDLLSACFLGWTFVVLGQFIKYPTAESFSFLWINLILLAHTRYESFIFSTIIIAGLLLFRHLDKQLFSRFSHVYFLTPLAAVPLVFQRILCHGKYENPPGVDLFSIKHFMINLRHFISAISDPTFFYPYPGLLLWISLLIIPFIAVKFMKGKLLQDHPEQRHLVYIVTLCLCAYLTIVFSYYFGDPMHPTSARFFVLPVVVMALIPVIAHRAWPLILTQRTLLIGTIGLLLLYYPVTNSDRFTQSLELIRETEHVMRYIESLNSRNVFIIAERPGIYTASKYGASDFEYANANKKVLLSELNNHLFSSIVVLQHVSYLDNKPLPKQVLDPDYVLGPSLGEYQITGDYYIRIAKITLQPEGAGVHTVYK